MADVRNDPSMEEILASIKRIIADDSAVVINQPRAARAPRAPAATAAEAPAPRVRRTAEDATSKPATPPPVASEILELTDQIAPEPQPAAPPPAATIDIAQPAGAPELISPITAEASRQAFAALAGQPVPPAQPAPAEDRTLEGLVREMLKPMLKEWLDARLPDLVEGVVQREIARIAGRPL
ncbi:DUF2497 domain-containing protein [Sphingomonas sp. KC8]|uniref:DUF2497 domain-containing protein n=1 Tax=Sphingomonas sp. KC8 TaxID=1030157 RepID=UPI000248A3EC|nr:DUF2497 domain-containing protein [Sphingomonas sp. KC8]ARS29180.1 hypothetical protein KC8_18065 [Sphingomonas sp. KC8]